MIFKRNAGCKASVVYTIVVLLLAVMMHAAVDIGLF